MAATIVILQLLVAQATAADSTTQWRKVFEDQPAITSVRPVSSFPGVDLARPLLDCPTFSPLKVEARAAFNLTIDIGQGRQTDLDVWISELPVAANAHAAVIAAGAGQVLDDRSCSLSKRGVSFLQVGRFWLGLPTLCRKGYYQSAVAVVLAAIHRAHAEEFPKAFIYAPCGSMAVRATDTETFLRKAAALPCNKRLQRTGLAPRR
jgi:hypothetical protein